MNDAKYVKASDVVDWFRPYGHMDESIPFEKLVSDLRDAIHAADVAPVVHARWVNVNKEVEQMCRCSACGYPVSYFWSRTEYCPHCGAKMDG